MKKYLFQSRIVSPYGVVSLVLCSNRKKLFSYLSENQANGHFCGYQIDEISKSKFWQSTKNDDIIIKTC